MHFFGDCLLLGYCFRWQQDDEKQTFADQLEQQPAELHCKVEQPEPDPELEQLELKANAEREMHVELKARLARPRPAATPLRGSHSPARLEEISVCADVHPRQLPAESAAIEPGAAVERFSGVAVKDEIEIFTEVDLQSDAQYLSF